MKLQRQNVLELLAFCGFKSAAQWDNERLAGKIPSIPDVMEGSDPPDADEQPELRKMYDEIFAAVAKKEKFEVEGEVQTGGMKQKSEKKEPPAAPPVEPPVEPPAETPAETPVENTKAGEPEQDVAVEDTTTKDEDTEGEDHEEASEVKNPEESAESPKKKLGRPKKSETTPKKPKEPKPVRRTTYYCAGIVVREHGTQNGITEAMRVRYAELVGRVNEVRTVEVLDRAIRIINGYNDVEEAPAKTAAASLSEESPNDPSSQENAVADDSRIEETASAE